MTGLHYAKYCDSTEAGCTRTRTFGFLAGVSGSRILAAAPILEPGSRHAESPNR